MHSEELRVSMWDGIPRVWSQDTEIYSPAAMKASICSDIYIAEPYMKSRHDRSPGPIAEVPFDDSQVQ